MKTERHHLAEDFSFEDFDRLRDVFAIDGDEMRTHQGRSVVAVVVGGRRHYLKRSWLAPSQLFKRHVARAFHEMRMIDWLNGHGFKGSKIVRRGSSGVGPFVRRVYFLMEEVENEKSLEIAWRRMSDCGDALVAALADFAARLHDASFVHTDFSERHILVGQEDERFTFRLIDLERATHGRIDHRRAAADLATLLASVADQELRDKLKTLFLDVYMDRRQQLPADVDFRAMAEAARPTKSFW